MHSDALGCIRMRSDTFGNFGEILEVFRTNLYSFDDSENFRRFSGVFGRVRMHSDVFGRLEALLEYLKPWIQLLHIFFHVVRSPGK